MKMYMVTQKGSEIVAGNLRGAVGDFNYDTGQFVAEYFKAWPLRSQAEDYIQAQGDCSGNFEVIALEVMPELE